MTTKKIMPQGESMIFCSVSDSRELQGCQSCLSIGCKVQYRSTPQGRFELPFQSFPFSDRYSFFFTSLSGCFAMTVWYSLFCFSLYIILYSEGFLSHFLCFVCFLTPFHCVFTVNMYNVSGGSKCHHQSTHLQQNYIMA